MLFCAGKLVQTVLNLSQLDWAGFNQTVAESGQLVYNRPNRFTQKMDLPRQEEVRPSRTSTHFTSPLNLAKCVQDKFCECHFTVWSYSWFVTQPSYLMFKFIEWFLSQVYDRIVCVPQLHYVCILNTLYILNSMLCKYLLLPLLSASSKEPHANYCQTHINSGCFGTEGCPPEHPQTSEGSGTALLHINRFAVSR